MSGDRPSSWAWTPRNAAIVVGASLVLVVWTVVGAIMLFSSGADQPVTQTAPSESPAITPVSKPKPSVVGYSPSTYTGPLPTLAAGKAPVPTAHPAQTTAPSSPSTSAPPATQPTDQAAGDSPHGGQHHHHHHHHHGGR